MSEIKTFFDAFKSAQAAFGRVGKDGKNPHFKSSYATLEAVIETVAEVLHENNFIFYQLPIMQDDKFVLETTIIHECGEKLVSICPIVAANMNDPQKLGSAITYMKRYSLMAMLGLIADDDDGQRAATPPKPKRSSDEQLADKVWNEIAGVSTAGAITAILVGPEMLGLKNRNVAIHDKIVEAARQKVLALPQ